MFDQPSQSFLPARFKDELNQTVRLAAPLALAQLAQIGMGVTDTVLLGALGRDALAAGGLGAGMFFTITAVLQGLVFGVSILVAHARGAGHHEKVAPLLRAGFVLATITAVPALLVFVTIEPVFLAIGEPEKLAGDAAAYIGVLAFATPAAMWMAVQRSYLAAMNHTRLVLGVSLAALLVNGVMNYGLIHGAWGLPEMGYMGSCTATLITTWLAMAVTAVGMRKSAPLLHDAKPLDWAVVRELLHLGGPIGFTLGVEIVLFLVAALMMGTLGATALAAHHVTITVASLTFMVPLGVAQAVNVRVGFHLGADNPRAARRAGGAALTLGISFMALTALAMFTLPRQIALLFNLDPAKGDDAEVIALIIELMAIGAVFQVFDGAQTIAAGALRGMKDTRVPAALAAFSYWGVGFPVAWALGFPAGWGAIGIWWGLAIGLATAAVVLNGRFWSLSTRLSRTGTT